jgi:hypothetical protein
MTEKQFQQTVVDMARALGWRVYHTYDSRRSERGFPDLVLVRDRIVYLELKTATGKVSLDQQQWIAALTAAGATALVVRPSDLDAIEHALRRRVDRKAT